MSARVSVGAVRRPVRGSFVRVVVGMGGPAGRAVGRAVSRAVSVALSVAVSVTAAGTLALLATASPAAADDTEDAIREYAMTIELDPDGIAHVALDLTVDFGIRPDHGPYLRWVVKERYDDERDRVYRITDVRASSPTAPGDVHTEELLGSGVTETAYLVGDEDVTVTGVHQYRITFDVEGWVNSAGYPWPSGPLENDELYLDVLTHWDIPVEQVSVDVRGPTSPLDAACYDATATCAAVARGASASFVVDRVDPRHPLTIAVAYPAGTFGGAEPVLQERWAVDRAFEVTPVTGGLAGAVAVGGGVLLRRRLHRTARDEAYQGLTPGLAPAAGRAATVGPRRRSPVAVQFAPPPGLRPGQLGTLIDEKADPQDVTATIIDLAVREYVRIVQVPTGDGEPDWRLDRSTKPDDDLRPYERTLLRQIFVGHDASSVKLSDLKTTFAAAMAEVQSKLYDEVTELGWFRGSPKAARQAWVLRGVGVLVLGLVVTVALAARTHWALVGLPLVVLGVVMLALTGSAPARTADGSAVLAQARGFRLYLETAEANQLRFEEGEDLFSRYLPFAVAFGLTERWAALFAELAAQGRALVEPTWFLGPYTGTYPFWAMAGSLGHDLTTFTSAATTAFSAPEPGSSGGSGFSGGGVGGGVGGGGGGTW